MPDTLNLIDELKLHFPGIEWSNDANGASSRIGCFVISIKKIDADSFYSTVDCFVAGSLAPIYQSTDILIGQPLSDAVALLLNWCKEQGDLMVAAISNPIP